ncbi:peptide MFS transporter [Paenibacillus sp. N1-5-1-14]|uniref:peptide MFS transporter n=1 Tax=Paenibacillus radicibacter TaxID=2972488 RepID=UPI002158D685|nr:peptide MFS transporter [Paenibacillus radicibacter]MCR8642451.1 peptide MFS transporter [Paenibacillus radicibacter]
MTTVNLDASTPSNKKKHPPGLYVLFFTEMWERFSYYGLRAMLVLYLTTTFISGGLGFSDSSATLIYGFFTGACYFTPLLGGYLTDRFLGRRKAITIGGIAIAIGNLALFLSQSTTALYIGLGLIIIGNGFFKPNISTLVGELYPKGDKRIDSAYTIFYMGINVGGLISPLVVGFLAESLFKTSFMDTITYGYKYGFLASCIGMIVGQIIFNLLAPRYLGDIGTVPTSQMNVSKTSDKSTSEKAANAPLTKKEKQRTTVILIITGFVVFFWAGFEQAGSSLTLYTKHFIDKTIFGWEVPTTWFQSINPMLIILLAPLVSMLWIKLSNRKRGDISIPTKMGIGMILLGVGYMVILIAIMKTGSDTNNIVQKANIMFIVGTYFFHTVGELFLSPVGLSLVNKIAPLKLTSLLMGVWLSSTGIANIVGGLFASRIKELGFFSVFSVIGLLAIVLGFVLLAVSKKLVRMADL